MKIGNLEVYGVIYKIINLTNRKVYIGQTTRENGFNGRYGFKGQGIERVYNYYEYKRNNQQTYNYHLLNSIKKYGFESFDVIEVLDIAFSQIELDIKEYIYIKRYNSTNRNFGYNSKEGGSNGKHSENSKCKIGNLVVCVNDGKIFKSKTEASLYYNVPVHYINKASQKNFYSNYNNYEYLRFKELKRNLKENEKICACCGIYFKLSYFKKSKRKDAPKIYNKSRKFCDKCKDEKHRKSKDKNKNNDYGMNIFYKYNN
ncbi:hypothetical protein [Clostridium sp.]|uniref:hypothetical protein n=1 Tax=Clostridium sp. TaxID=1506 RepID=UPI001DADE022|nr:hypothetical protein [Clostridium sp.]MBS5307762.1 hypothetical protein [Clostridium sp.]